MITFIIDSLLFLLSISGFLHCLMPRFSLQKRHLRAISKRNKENKKKIKLQSEDQDLNETNVVEEEIEDNEEDFVDFALARKDNDNKDNDHILENPSFSPCSFPTANTNTAAINSSRPLHYCGLSIRTQQRKNHQLSLASSGCKTISSFFSTQNSPKNNNSSEMFHEQTRLLSLEESIDLINQLPFLQNNEKNSKKTDKINHSFEVTRALSVRICKKEL
jgi:hypothetical protein